MSDDIDTRLRDVLPWDADVEEVQKLVDTLIAEENEEIFLENRELREKSEADERFIRSLHYKLRSTEEALTHSAYERRRLSDHLFHITIHPSRLVRWLMRKKHLNAPTSVYHDTQYVALSRILAELGFQDAKWGSGRHQTDGTGEEFFSRDLSDSVRRLTELKFEAGQGTWADILLEEVYEALCERNPRKLKAELIQVAAVCAAWVVDIETRPTKK